MLNKDIETEILRWEMKSSGEISAALDTFNFTVKTKRYFLNGYLNIDKQLHQTGQVENDKFFINYVKKDLKKKGIVVDQFQTAPEFRRATQGIFFQHFCEVYEEMRLLLDTCRSFPFFILTESEVDVLDEKLRALKKLDTSYIVHADILLTGESYSKLLFSPEREINEDTFMGKVEKILHSALHAKSIFTLPQKTLLEQTLGTYLDVNQRKLTVDGQTNLARIALYTNRYQTLQNELHDYLTQTNCVKFFETEVILNTVNSTELTLIDKVKILSLIVKDMEKHLHDNLLHLQTVDQLHPAYHGLNVLIVQSKLVITLNKLIHDFYCGMLTQCIKLELLKVSIIHHFLNK